jgi:prepilin-type N-terminal cleavage/methylation domain-containing protein
MERPSTVSSVSPKDPSSARRSGFTLVELLVVIVILAMLAALVTPAVMRSLNKARNSAIKAEIDLLHMAMMNYQSEYGAVPPCVEPLKYWSTNQYTKGGPAAKHLQRLFPRCAQPDVQLNTAIPWRLTQINALVAWLTGFTPSPTAPLVPAASRVKLFDFDQSRIDSSTAAYFPSGRKGSQYIYFDSSSYQSSFTDGTNTYTPVRRPRPNPATGVTEFFNPTSFQILCAGRDEQWGEDLNCNGVLDTEEDANGNGVLDSGEDLNGNGMLDRNEDVNGNGILDPGAEDDLSNFWPGTRKEYIDSLK